MRLKRYLLLGLLAVLLTIFGYMLGRRRWIVDPGTRGGVAELIPIPRLAVASKNAQVEVDMQPISLKLSSLKLSSFEPELAPPSNNAVALYRDIVRQRPQDADAHQSLALALYSRGDLDAAIAEFRKGVSLRPTDPTAHNDLGVALYKKGQENAALDEFRTAHGLDPKDLIANLNYQLLQWDQQDRQRAEALEKMGVKASEKYRVELLNKDEISHPERKPD